MKAITAKELRASSHLLQPTAITWAIENLAYLNAPMTLFGSSQKVEKGADKFETRILYLQPAGKVARKTLCVGASAAGCESPCLISSGQLGMSTGQRAATKRTLLLLLRRETFLARMSAEIAKAERKAIKTGIPCLFRLNGTSDIDWSEFIAAHPESQFYDYTKVLARLRHGLANYDVTYSGSMYSKQSRAALGKAVQRGHRIAVALNTKLIASDAPALAETYANLANFDNDDLRHLNPIGIVGGLTRKGSNKTERAIEDATVDSFFITSANVDTFNAILRGTT